MPPHIALERGVAHRSLCAFSRCSGVPAVCIGRLWKLHCHIEGLVAWLAQWSRGAPFFPPGKQEKFEGLGYSPAVTCGPFLFVAGQVGVGDSGVVEDPEAQFRLAFEKLFALCREAGFSVPGDLVEVKTFHVDMGQARGSIL